MLDATILVAGGLSDGAPSAAAVELLTAARSLTSAAVVAVVSGKVDAAAWGNYGAAACWWLIMPGLMSWFLLLGLTQ